MKKMSMPKEKPATRKKNDEQWKKNDEQFVALRPSVQGLAAELRRDFEVIGARLLKAQQESFRSQFGVLDDKYRDLPARVTTLEDRVGITR